MTYFCKYDVDVIMTLMDILGLRTTLARNLDYSEHCHIGKKNYLGPRLPVFSNRLLTFIMKI